MSAPYRIRFGSYTFPNDTFEVAGLPLENQLDEANIPRRDGSRILASKLGPRRIRIKGQLHGADEDTVHSALNEFFNQLSTMGEQQLKYRSDRYMKCWVRSFGHSYSQGAYAPGTGYGGVAAIDIQMQAADPFLYSTSLTTHTIAADALVNTSLLFDVVNPNIVSAVPQIILVPGVTLSDVIFFHNRTTGERFQWHGTLAPGMTLTVDSEEQSVELGSGVDALSLYEGDFITLNGLTNNFRIAGFTLSNLLVVYRPRYLA